MKTTIITISNSGNEFNNKEESNVIQGNGAVPAVKLNTGMPIAFPPLPELPKSSLNNTDSENRNTKLT